MTSDDNERLSEDSNWVRSTGLQRRHVLAGGAFAAGFAAACRPVASSAVQTPGDGLTEEMVSIAADDGFALPAFVARPAGGKAAPVIVVVHEIFGVHEWIRDICRRFAKAGYYAIAPDLFARHGDATKIADFKQLVGTIVSKAPDAQVLADIDTVYDWAGSHGGDGKKRGITGFCWGGRIVWLYAAHSAKLNAGVAYYGRLVSDKTALQPLSAIEEVGKLKAPVLGQYGALDKGIPVADVDAMRAALTKAGKSPPDAITVHAGAEHGFMADYRPSYNEAAAKAAWDATLGWFGTYVKK
ncbi:MULTISPECIES: dienelactone hydrolase family protein [Sphingobium]|jgi:carboxymethylenebutenolidase|uniref:dienelactone hydrolase family protein n=1 Tax=Sphingobium TaxID=165695 RepID=UPI000DBB0CA4|nr:MULTISPECIES: dienelactone hydrolase family protein [Sphingobium]KAA9015582.1 dienelactone hydrolase family protein [Sphingobium limneticum]MBU0931981.1 dienelactone hydrolase family protein [Alphaproteobacteria bacterium]BBD01610.1 carboxymethylenebutenolidase [Sphingobium sp. YG1]